MPARAAKTASLLIGALLLFLVSTPAHARLKILHEEVKLVFADGAQLTKAYSGDLRLEVPKIKGRAVSGDSLSPDRDGLVRLSFSRPGRYRLKLMGIPVAEFSVARAKEGLETRGLPAVIKLPFTHVLEVKPPRRVEKYKDPKTGRERTRSVPMQVDWTQVWVGEPGRKQAVKLWPYKFHKYAGGFDARKTAIVTATAPGCAPWVTAARLPKPNRAGQLNSRKVGINLVPVSYDSQHPGQTRGAPKAPVHNIKKQTLYWLNRVRFNREDHWYLLSYNLKKKRGAVAPLQLPSGLGKTSSTSLYLDEKGALHAYRRLKGPDGKLQGQCFSVQAQGPAAPVADCVYPNFRFHGQVYGNGGRWLMPNIGGVPLRVGGNDISVSGTVRIGQRTTSASDSYTITVEGPVPHVVGKVPSTQCTGKIQSAHEDDRRLCLDPPVSPEFYKGPAPSLEKACPRPKNGCGNSEDCRQRMRKCRKRFQKSLAAWQRYRPQPPCYGEMINGKANFGGVSVTYAGPVEYHVATDFGPEGQPLHSVKRTEIMSGLPSLRKDNWLVDSSMGWGALREPINLREGPYPELRYRAKRIDPATLKQSRRYGVVKLYPWNYRVRTEGRQIIADRSGILRPTPPPKEQKAEAEAGAYLEVLSPDPEGRHALAGPDAEVRIRLRYDLGGAPQGTLKISADHASGTLYSQSLALPGPGGVREIAFKVRPPQGSPQFGVGLELIAAGAASGSEARIYYYFPAGAFSLAIKTDKPVAAHPKNHTQLHLTVKDEAGRPLANRAMSLLLVDPHINWLRGGYLGHLGGASAELTTDAQGRAEVLYIPPNAAMTPKGDSVGTFPVKVELELRDRADPEQRTRATLELVSPWPRITKLAIPSGDLAGHWQGSDSRVVIADADNDVFDITIWGPGEFGYHGGHGRQEKLAVLDEASPFRFRFKSRPMGLDLNDIPTDWGMLKDFGKTNGKILLRIALLVGGKYLLKQHGVTGSAKTTTHTSYVTKTVGGSAKVTKTASKASKIGKLGSDVDVSIPNAGSLGKAGKLSGKVGSDIDISIPKVSSLGKAGKLSKMGSRVGSDVDVDIVTKVKVVTTFENALPDSTWATELLDFSDATIGMTKNTAEVMNAASQMPMDVKTAGNMGYRHDMDAALDGMHTAVGVVDTIVAFKDLLAGAPMNVKLEIAKAIYENAKMAYGWHQQNLKVAESWEDITFVPILVEVKDREGHRVRRLGRLGIKFAKEQGQQ